MRKKVLITGNTGFKGSWLSFWLSQMLEANVYGLSNGVLDSPNLFECLDLKSETDYRVVDIRNFGLLILLLMKMFFLPDLKRNC